MDKSIYAKLSQVDMSNHIKSVQNQRFVSWSSQWGTLLKHYPEATFEVFENQVGDPFTVSIVGIMVKVSVTIEGLTRTINYPVLNSSNKALKVEPYEYETKRGINKVAAATTFDINSSIVRALTKCIALFGLSLYVYQDELQPEIETVSSTQLQAITDKIKERGLSLKEVTEEWQLSKISHLYENNFEAFYKYLETK